VVLLKKIKKSVVSSVKKRDDIKSFSKKEIPKLHYAMIHSRLGYPDGVSIVMKQIEKVMVENMKIPEKNIFYFVGRSKEKSNRVFESELIFDGTSIQKMIQKNFKKGFGGRISERIEKAILKTQKNIELFVDKNKIDVIIAHNACHPVNFIMALGISRYYRDAMKKNKKTPKYLLWWHDSHLEREIFKNPPVDVERYLIQGVPGRFVEYIFFINSLQFFEAEKYFRKIDLSSKGFFDYIYKNNDVIYNTTDTFIQSYKDLRLQSSERVDKFITDFGIVELLKKNKKNLSDTIFCLQHTRMVQRKRIDIALKYCFLLLKKINKRAKKKKCIYFIISGHDADGTKIKLKKLYSRLCLKNPSEKVLLVFAEDYDGKTDIKFEEYPRIIARLGGFSTYFSEIEGFGNNLLEVLASGLIPVVYTYPVFKADIAKYKFRLIQVESFKKFEDSIPEVITIIKNNKKRKEFVNENILILKKRFPHKIISLKLTRGIIRERTRK
jgi:mannosylglucosylglycerate synthase